MTSLVASFTQRGLIQPPAFLPDSVQLEVSMGSRAFGTSRPQSDWDIYGFCVPPDGVNGFTDFEALDVVESEGDKPGNYDFKIHGLNAFFDRLLKGKSQVVEMLFTADANVLYMTPAAKLLRDNRALFLHHGTAREFRRFAWQQLDDLRHQRRRSEKNEESIERFGYDVKPAYHVMRLMTQAQQLWRDNRLVLGLHRQMLLEIRAGAWSLDRLVAAFAEMDQQLNELAAATNLAAAPNTVALTDLFHQVQATAQGLPV